MSVATAFPVSRISPVHSPFPRRSETVQNQTAINTIRTHSAMDAVQAADSGHPGTPMAMAPVAYTLWQHFLRFDPQDPVWPNRDRFVLSMGHASMLLYSLLHLTEVRAVSKDYETLRRKVSVPLDSHQGVPPVGQRLSGPSGVSLDIRRRNYFHRPPRPGRRHQCGHGHWARVAGRAQPKTVPNFESLFDFNVHCFAVTGA